jgi:aldehyde dehydrogenase (NAD+)
MKVMKVAARPAIAEGNQVINRSACHSVPVLYLLKYSGDVHNALEIKKVQGLSLQIMTNNTSTRS